MNLIWNSKTKTLEDSAPESTEHVMLYIPSVLTPDDADEPYLARALLVDTEHYSEAVEAFDTLHPSKFIQRYTETIHNNHDDPKLEGFRLTVVHVLERTCLVHSFTQDSISYSSYQSSQDIAIDVDGARYL